MPADMHLVDVLVSPAELAIASGDPVAASKLAQHAQTRLNAALAPACGRADREADATAAYYREMLS